jgi:hypothetical protein
LGERHKLISQMQVLIGIFWVGRCNSLTTNTSCRRGTTRR